MKIHKKRIRLFLWIFGFSCFIFLIVNFVSNERSPHSEFDAFGLYYFDEDVNVSFSGLLNGNEAHNVYLDFCADPITNKDFIQDIPKLINLMESSLYSGYSKKKLEDGNLFPLYQDHKMFSMINPYSIAGEWSHIDIIITNRLEPKDLKRHVQPLKGVSESRFEIAKLSRNLSMHDENIVIVYRYKSSRNERKFSLYTAEDKTLFNKLEQFYDTLK